MSAKNGDYKNNPKIRFIQSENKGLWRYYVDFEEAERESN